MYCMAHRTGGLRCTTPATCRGSELWACCSTMVQMPQLETRHVQPDLPHTHTVALPDTLHKRRGCRLGIPRWRLPRAPGMRRSCSSWRTGARCLVVCSTTRAVLSMHRTRYGTGFGVAVVDFCSTSVLGLAERLYGLALRSRSWQHASGYLPTGARRESQSVHRMWH